MRLYFAFGSNMSRRRLEGRVGSVESEGHTLLASHVHSFSHLGRDGSGKGNIEPAVGHQVEGVLYRLQAGQVDLLQQFEGGYSMIDVQVSSPCGEQCWQAYTYMAPKDADWLLPQDFYLEHYLHGMQENRFPQSYIDLITEQARR
ncbi:MAG: gamma-glutamylcyclotransferase [Myxococcales bacterium]|nr:gamma-glutamylcyclotransferase [Myxococcales bacterium]